MDSNERWSKRPHSTITQRNVDKELQRIKSLAVVSVLNKSFNKEPGAPLRSSSLAPIPSPSSSLTTEGEDLEGSATQTRSRSLSVHSLKNLSTSKRKSNNILHNEYIHDTPNSLKETLNSSLSIGIFDSDQIALAEKETNLDSLVINSLVDTEKEILIKRVQELEELYDTSIKDLRIAEDRNNTQSELVMLQDKLIQNISNQLECLTMETTSRSKNFTVGTIDLETTEGKHLLESTQRELAYVSKDLSDIKSLKTHYESVIADMSAQLLLYESKVDKMESIAKSIQKEHSKQIEFIDTKVQTLVQQLLETNDTMNRLQVEHIQEKHALLAKQQELTTYNGSIKSMNDSSSSVIWEAYEENEDSIGTNPISSSFTSMSTRNDNQQRRSFIARWKGNSMPPASPPPSSPLPPIPTGISRSSNRPKSTLSEIYTANSTSTISQNYKHVSIDAVGGIERRTSSILSELETEITDAAYYKEFTDQLQERLSVSKEIDDLKVWTPSDYDLIQKKIESKRWSSGSDEGNQRDQTAFWKGMKKKLRV